MSMPTFWNITTDNHGLGNTNLKYELERLSDFGKCCATDLRLVYCRLHGSEADRAWPLFINISRWLTHKTPAGLSNITLTRGNPNHKTPVPHELARDDSPSLDRVNHPT